MTNIIIVVVISCNINVMLRFVLIYYLLFCDILNYFLLFYV